MTQVPDLPLSGLYGDRILDHYRHPRNRCPLESPDLSASEFNPFCGDRVQLQLKLDQQDRVAGSCAESEGCSIIQASASMLSCLVEGKSLEEVETLSGNFRLMMEGGDLPAGTLEDLGDLAALKVVRAYPVRIKCARLPWVALEEGVESYRKGVR